MGFPSTPTLDTFSRTEGPPPSANWGLASNVYGATYDDWKSLISQALPNSFLQSYVVGWWSTSTFGPDVEVFCKVVTFSNGVYLTARGKEYSSGSATADNYMGYFSAGTTDNIGIYKITNTSAALIGALGSHTIANGDLIGMQIIGSTITLWHNSGAGWEQILERSDSDFSGAGYIGVETDGVATIIDDFGGGTIQPQRKTLSPLGTRTGSRQVRCC